MADSIERIAGEIDARSGNANGITPAELMGWATRLRALSPAGGPELADVERRFLSVRDMLPGDYITGYTEALAHIRAAMLAASPQQEPGAVRDLTECGHSKYDPCHNCEPTTADESGPAINSAETYSKPIADPSGQTLAGAGPTTCECGEPERGGHAVWCPMSALTATSAGTTGDDSEDAARLDWCASNLTMWNGEKHVPATREHIDAARRARTGDSQ